MAEDHSMDVVVNFDMQELRNAVDQAKKEVLTRYDFKDSNIEIELAENEIKVNVANEMQIDAVFEILVKRMAGRNISSKILDRKPFEPAGGMRFRQEIKLVKALDQENAKIISKLVRDNFPKAKGNIQGDTVRVTSKSIDDLQGVMALLRSSSEIKVPVHFTNYR
ncbi:MAG: YajQ family cyclic di-GMP-binding protein [Patescibacteria group bacterium]